MIEIILGSYQGETYIGEQLQSIQDNTRTDWFVTVCDDGSTDKTVEIVKEWEQQYPDKFHLIQNKHNLGPAMNFLQHASKSSADYVMFCDQDDYWHQDKIEVTLEKMMEMEHTNGKGIPYAVFTDASVVNEKRGMIHPSFFQSNHLDYTKTDLPHLLMENKLLGCTVMFNHEIIKYLNMQLPGYCKMHDWWVGLIAASFGKIGFVNQPTMDYRQHGNNVIGNQSYGSYIKRRLAHIGIQRESLKQLQKQAQEFHTIFQRALPACQEKIVQTFAGLHRCNVLVRRYYMLTFHFYKTGLIRNVAVFILL